MLRLRMTAGPTGTTLFAEGRLEGDWVGLLEEECQRILAGHHALSIDLSQVTYVDTRAVQRLRSLAGAGTRLIRTPPLIRDILAEE